jgi:hypothetical protein
VNFTVSGYLPTAWAIPGFANFFLSEDIFLTALQKQRKSGPAVPGNPESRNHHHTAMYAQTLFSIVFAMTRLNERSSMITNNVTAALIKRLMLSWVCPYTRASFTPSFTNFVYKIFHRAFLIANVSVAPEQTSDEEAYEIFLQLHPKIMCAIVGSKLDEHGHDLLNAEGHRQPNDVSPGTALTDRKNLEPCGCVARRQRRAQRYHDGRYQDVHQYKEVYSCALQCHASTHVPL